MNLDGLRVSTLPEDDGDPFYMMDWGPELEQLSDLTRPASPADILPRLGFVKCGDCGGTGEGPMIGKPPASHRIFGQKSACPSCRGGWTPGDEMVEDMAKAIGRVSYLWGDDEPNEATGFVLVDEATRAARAAALAMLDHLLEGDAE
jgi:hypothetical protein